MIFTAGQLVAHAVGDYLLQSDWMALNKTKNKWAAAAHVLTYSLPFLLVTQSFWALFFIATTHFVIDHWRLARYVVWAKNFLAPRSTVMYFLKASRSVGKSTDIQYPSPIPERKDEVWWHPWSECRDTGYHKDRPPWLATWLLIIADNTMHVVCNGLAIYLLGGP